jgi:hypothetical protein
MATCPNGHENPEGQNFCGECGASLVARPADEPPTPSTGQPRGKPESREQRGDESELVKSPDHSSPKSHALAEAEAAVEVAEAEAAAAAARARVARMKAMNTLRQDQSRSRNSRSRSPSNSRRNRANSAHPSDLV